jgi:phage terminase large subunit
MKMLPEQYIKHHAKQKNYVDIVNGHRVLFRTLDEETKARSLNLSAFWIEEANTVAYEYFVQLQTRLRNTATTKHIGILSSNPDNNWIKNEFLLKSKHIYNSETKYHQDPLEINRQFSTHIAPTHLNTYLPPNFYEDTARGKMDWWIKRFLHGSFENKEGKHINYALYKRDKIGGSLSAIA